MSLLLLMGGRGFKGAYDGIPNIVHAYEPARRVLTSYTGNLLRLRRASDSAEANFTYDVAGNLDVAAIAAWAGGVSYVVTVYDQKGSSNVTCPTAAYQPLFVASAQNGHAAMTFDGVDDYLQDAAYTEGALSQPFSVYCCGALVFQSQSTYKMLDGGSVLRMIMGVTGGGGNVGWYYVHAGAAVPTPENQTENFMMLSALFNGVSSEARFNGNAPGTGNAGTNEAIGITVGGTWSLAATQFWKGIIASVLVCDPAHTDAQRLAVQTAFNRYWGIY